MSRQFYWKTPRIETLLPTGKKFVLEADDMDVLVHIGGMAQYTFTWCQEPDSVRAICNARPNDVLIADEYHMEYTGRGFLDLIESRTANLGLLGKRFC